MKVSIIVPVYNKEKYLSRCIDSLIKQTYKDLEILLIDDGSTDRSLEICQRYAQTDERIQVISQPNGGVSSARNLGIENISKDSHYLSFVDGDDWLELEMYERMMSLGQGAYDEMIVCGVNLYEKGEKKDLVVGGGQQLMSNREAHKGLLLGKGLSRTPCGKLYPIRAVGGERFDTALYHSEDWEFLVRVLGESGCKVRYLPEPFYNYQRNETSASLTKLTDRRLTEILAHEKIYRYYREKGDDLKGLASYQVFSTTKELLRRSVVEDRREYIPKLKIICHKYLWKLLKANISLKMKLYAIKWTMINVIKLKG